jgi:hypothetical protein
MGGAMKEAMKMALEALEENHHLIEEHEHPDYLANYDRVISEVAKALAKQGELKITKEKTLQNLHDENVRLGLYEQEQGEPNIQSYLEKDNSQPVAWMDIDEKGAASGLRYWSEPDNRHEVALYTK